METIYLIQGFAAPWLDTFLTWVTDLGSQEAYIALLVITYLAIDATAGRTIAVALLASFMINQYAKGFFDTLRPFEIDPDVVRSQRALEGATGAGFPSGHAQSALTFWGVAAVMARRAWFTVLALLLVALIAFSRLYLGVHLPVDVWGGLAIAFVIVLFVWLVRRAGLGLPGFLALILGVGLPLALHLLWPTPESDLLAGGMAAFVLGPMILRHRTDGPLWGRLLLAVLGLVMAFTVLAASSQFLPEEIKRDPAGGFLRYLILGLTVTVVVPWMGRAFSLVPSDRRRRA